MSKEPSASTSIAPMPQADFFVGDHVEIADRLSQDLTSEFGQAPVATDGALWVYDQRSGIYIKLPREQLSQRVQSYSGKLVAGERKAHPLRLKHGDVSGIIQVLRDKLHVPDFFATEATSGLAFTNGYLRVDGAAVKLVAHSPKHRGTMTLGFGYDASATAPRFEQFLWDVFRDDDDAAEKIALLQEHAGACLLGVAPRFQLALVLLGQGANGKSSFLDMITGVFPSEWKASISPHAWGHEYSRSLLPGVRINAVNELPDRELMASEMIKAIVSGDAIQARVIREQPFTFRPIAGQLFATNDLPAITDQSHGLWRRFALVSFDRVFSESEMVRGLAEQILRDERPGIVNWMLGGAQRLLQRGEYAIPPSSDAAKDKWRKASDSVASFIEEEMEVINESTDTATTATLQRLGYMPAQIAYHRYREYCRDGGFKSVSSRKFSERLQVMGVVRAETRECRWYAIRQRAHIEPLVAPGTVAAAPLAN